MDPAVPDSRLWTDKYSLNFQMIPSFLTFDIAQQILQTGKAVNFIRRCCHEDDWAMETDFDIGEWVNDRSDFESLRKWVDRVAEERNRALIEILFEKYRFFDHCEAIRRYLLLGQGDFVQALMTAMAEELQKPAVQLFKHNMTNLLKQAIRQSNAQFHDPEFLNRLDVKLLESNPGDNGWDVFSLDYEVDEPINTILTPNIVLGYLKIFNFLWKLKRVEFMLGECFKTQNQRHLHRLKEIRGDLHACNLLRHEMTHLISNLHSYLVVEVVEKSWQGFKGQVHEASSLDEVRTIQNKFMEQLLEQAFLTNSRTEIYKHVNRIFELIHKFKYTQDVLYTSAEEEFQSREHLRVRMNDSELPEEGNKISPQACNQLHQLSKDYRRAFEDLNILLEESKDVNLKFLLFRLDFNEYYKAERERHPGMDFDALNPEGEYGSEEDSESEEEESEDEYSGY